MMKRRRIEPWRIVVAVISFWVIILMWARKDIVSILGTVSGKDAIPMIMTSLAVSLVKVLLIAAAVFVVRWIVSKIQNKNQKQ